MPDTELYKLARSLTMKGYNIDNVLNILNYLGKLNDDTKNNIFSRNPLSVFINQPDVLFKTLKDLEIDDIMNFCVSSNNINKNCISSKIINLIRSKLQRLDTLDLSTYNLKELILFSKIIKFKEYNNLSKQGEFSDIIM